MMATLDAQHIDRLQCALNQVYDLEIAYKDNTAEIQRHLKQRRQIRRSLGDARRELAYAEWVARILTEGANQPEPEDGAYV